MPFIEFIFPAPPQFDCFEINATGGAFTRGTVWLVAAGGAYCDFTGGTALLRIEHPFVDSLALSTDDASLALGDDTGTLEINFSSDFLALLIPSAYSYTLDYTAPDTTVTRLLSGIITVTAAALPLPADPHTRRTLAADHAITETVEFAWGSQFDYFTLRSATPYTRRTLWRDAIGGTPVDLTGGSATLLMSSPGRADITLSTGAASIALEAEPGSLDIIFSAALFATLPSAVAYSYTLDYTAPDTTVTRLLAGSITTPA